MLNKTLLIRINVSRENGLKPTSRFNSGARQAYSANAPPTMKTISARINTPRAGSVAKA